MCSKDEDWEMNSFKVKQDLYITRNVITTLFDWQTKTLHNICEQNEREVLWISDEEGGKSKTSLAVYIIEHFNNVAYLENIHSID